MSEIKNKVIDIIADRLSRDKATITEASNIVADLGANYTLTKRLSLFLNCENLGNARIETGRSADGIVNLGTPRLFLAGLRGSW